VQQCSWVSSDRKRTEHIPQELSASIHNEEHGRHDPKKGDVPLLPTKLGPQQFGLYPRLSSDRPASRDR
jgi:hypothetical protein